MSDITEVVKALCSPRQLDAHGAALAPAIDPVAMRGAFAAVLDGGASDLEIGALMAVSLSLESPRTANSFAEIILGLNDAIRDRKTTLIVDAGSAPVVVFPNYSDENSYPAMPLTALLLRRLGVRVLVHGAVETHGGLLNSGIFREFGILPAATRGQAAAQFAENGIALLPAALFSPGLAAMLSLRNRLGIRTPAHALANMLMPVLDPSTRSLHVVHIAPWLTACLAEESLVREVPALLVAAEESHSDAGESRAYFAFHDGECGCGWQTLFGSDCMPLSAESHDVPTFDSALDQHDPRAWAAWTRKRLDGNAGLPLRAASLFACCLYGCGYAHDIHQAKAMVALDPGNQAAYLGLGALSSPLIVSPALT
jgi:anthranilate phosphoribosyltransferase